MIFITVGTEKFAFDRLFRAVEEAVRRGEIRQEVFAQIGHSRLEPVLFKWARFIDFDRQAELMKKADIIVSHAGEGSILLALSLGKMPVVFPRQAVFKEHLDDHQIEFARKLEESRKVIAAYTDRELIEKIKDYGRLAGQAGTLGAGKNRQELIARLRQICDSRGFTSTAG